MKNDNSIPLTTAQGWAKTWVNSQPAGAVKAHLIPMEDFVALSKEEGVENIRAYIGIDENGVNKLMLVGVNAKGLDMVNEEIGERVYDFTAPCPTTCDPSSPLFIVKEKE
ncbi:hypothetical protein SY27_06225 [Flavobacterium sp. 316]|uniref:Uncharacterized protein n=1 Tax=Flavobacterium sediminilitoris TaxID=2024526 RepID=A0ABY4HIU6_9FLAO|nr:MULTISPECIES: hypothetical protein [Flavobacterium]KIX22245.1 hypothetical protein SY27_06225 [Flavobacterium sp. 316]UOX32571.1 hypothetical protein LXD69_10975 [Flavobacterium sediminilitoris]